MTREEIIERFPNATEDFIRRNVDSTAELQNPQPQPRPFYVPERAYESKEVRSGRCRVSITSFRCKPVDIDNLAGGSKFLIDGLRYAGLIPDDSPDAIDLAIGQQKVATRIEEGTTVKIFYP